MRPCRHRLRRCPAAGARSAARTARGERPGRCIAKGASLKGVHWTEPALVAEVRYGNWTADKVLRHAAFVGLREDKRAAEVVRDTVCRRRPFPQRWQSHDARRTARDGSTEFEGVG